MRAKFSSVAALTICLLFLTSGAFAQIIPVANFSFETLPSEGLNNSCGGTCAYSTGEGIPDWTTTGFYTGQWIPGGYAGNPPAYNGNYLAYSNGGTISQNVAVVIAGGTYTLQVEMLQRTDLPLDGVAQLTVNGVVVATATGTSGGPGTWSDWTAHFTATPAEAGKVLGILLTANGAQGDFDDVRLNLPERSNVALLLGFGICNLAAVFGFRRKLI